MILKISKKDIRKDNPWIDNVDGLKQCTSKELKYVGFCYDYQTPFRNMSFEDKRYKALESAGYSEDAPDTKKVFKGSNKRLERAIEVYESMQRDFDRELLMSYDNQLIEYMNFLKKKDKDTKERAQALNILKQMPTLIKYRKEIVDTLELRGVDTKFTEKSEEEQEVHKISALDQYNIDSINDEK